MTENEKDQKYLEAKNMWNNGNISDALDLLYYLSKEEHAESQLFYGMIFIQRKDIDEAYFWLKKAADNGSKDALELLRTGGINYTPQKPSSSSAPNSGGFGMDGDADDDDEEEIIIDPSAPYKGKLMIKDGEYEGDIVNGKPHGKGIYTDLVFDSVYEGEWVNGKEHGKGKLTAEDGTVINEGNWKDGEFIGK